MAKVQNINLSKCTRARKQFYLLLEDARGDFNWDERRGIGTKLPAAKILVAKFFCKQVSFQFSTEQCELCAPA
jgi:hypothetical protein